MIESKCEFCNTMFLAHSKQRTCSCKCGYALRSQEQTKWSQEKIIEQIQNLHAQDIPLNCNQLKKNGHTPLVRASYSYFKSWKNAVEMAGLSSVNKRWNREEIIKQIRKWNNESKPLNYYAVCQHDPNFVSAVSRYFASWDAMLLEAEIPSQRCYIEWDEDKVIRIAKQQHKMGYAMHRSAVRNRDRKLHQAALNRFGSWRSALKRAGIPYVCYETKWNAKIVERWLRKMSEKQIPLNSNYLQKHHDTFYSAATRYFGSWDNALRAADINPLDVKRSCFWRSELVIKIIRERHDKKQSLYSQDVDREHSSLKVMAKRFFGSWKKAIESAGLTYKRKVPPLWGEEILGLVLSDFFPDKKFIKNCRELNWLVGVKGHRLELDFYCKGLELGLEFQGPTHSTPVFGEKELSRQRIRDERKRRLCDENGLRLIEIQYNDFSPKVLSQKLSKHDIYHKYSETHIAVCNKYKFACKFA